MIDPASIQDLVGRWWFNYDQGNFEALPELLTQDVRFEARTDTGTTAIEEYVRADLRGRAAVVAWQVDHRTNSPSPLRHNATNVHVIEQRDGEATFASYLFVTVVEGGRPAPISSAICRGTVRQDSTGLRIAAFEIVLDTETSVTFADR